MVDLRQWLRAVDSLRRFRAFAFRTYTSRHLMFVSAETRLWAHKREYLYDFKTFCPRVSFFLYFFFHPPIASRAHVK